MSFHFVLFVFCVSKFHFISAYQCICNNNVAYNILPEPKPRPIGTAEVIGVSYTGDCFFYNGTEIKENETFWKTDIKGKAGWFWYVGYEEPHIGNCSNPIRDVKEEANCLYLMVSEGLYSHPNISKENKITEIRSCRRIEDCPQLISNEAFYINNNTWYNVTYQNKMSGYVLADEPIRWHCTHYVVDSYVLSDVLPVWEIVTIAFSVLVLLVLIVLAGIVYRRRLSKLRWIPPHIELNQEQQFGTNFDVFLSYSRLDWDWVRTVLFRKLQDEGYSVCIDFKDFVPGVDISENIINAIYSSKNTIVVMSKNFLNSVWGEFELRQAHYKTIAQKKDTMILIKFGKCKIPRQLMGKTFLDWTTKKEQSYFWKRLFKSMGRQTNPC